MNKTNSKISIIGAGNVGSTFAYALMLSGAAREIVLVDRDRKRAEGECMDLNHGMSFTRPARIYASGYEGCAGADIVVITAGAKQKPGQSRLELVQKNADIFKEIIPEVIRYAKDAILLVVTNPVDVLTYATIKISGFSPNRVLGSGTVLDSSRLRFLISQHCHVDPRNVHAYIIGEHGDSELPVWSLASIGGMVLSEYCPLCDERCDYLKTLGGIFAEVKNAAYKIIDAKGATYYAVALALVRIVEAILRDENSVLPVSSLIEGYYGIDDVCLSVPALVNRKGIVRALRLKLSEKEREQFQGSAKKLQEIIDQVKW
ncbi:MAG: L-lactate dehydrogenase [Candidatus Omnitrophica bacterium]|nr:L-lactate dehydrogenase [Candidatus Omnitrophota bacterium]